MVPAHFNILQPLLFKVSSRLHVEPVGLVIHWFPSDAHTCRGYCRNRLFVRCALVDRRGWTDEMMYEIVLYGMNGEIRLYWQKWVSLLDKAPPLLLRGGYP